MKSNLSILRIWRAVLVCSSIERQISHFEHSTLSNVLLVNRYRSVMQTLNSVQRKGMFEYERVIYMYCSHGF